ncbi:pyridoxal-dependent decarboxylase [Fluviispira sanaruensis]|uniref:Putative pyridoxal-dependent aspartate 1-decarboxylase n=1 Tax=Fluviispira sanaruensis TaxID=2493639 RepID=A0A4P2VK56_FLUSA|nr:pyridoxal-dependent decarboxylase [Fluviispira sanaruensis]BBH53606.1 putative pyridoxal-dependent aspartate 1-decarboxylase [Fluviispira sanaruensis]
MNISSLISRYFHSSINDIEFQKWVSISLKAILDFLENHNGFKIHSDKLPSEISKKFISLKIPDKGQTIPIVLNETIENIIKNSVHVSHPAFIGHMTGASPHFLLICDLIISALNQNVVKIETALSATFVEMQTLCWLHRLIYEKSENYYKNILQSSQGSVGNCCSGGTIGNITALVAARNNAFPELHKKGVYLSYKNAQCVRAVVLVSERGHYSIKKACAVMGIGEENVISIPCHFFTNKINIAELKKRIQNLTLNKVKIIAIIGIAASTETGNVDDLSILARICKENKIWFHVDAAWGGAILLSNKYKNLLKGIKKADSVVIDGHKFMYLTMSQSAVLFKNKKSLDSLHQSAHYIIREGSVDLGKTSIEGSRRFDSLKLWFSFKVFGREGYESLINNAIKNAFLLAQLVSAHTSFELTSQPETSIVTYRFMPKELKMRMELAKKIHFLENKIFAKELKKFDFGKTADFLRVTKKINSILNEINTNLQKEQRKIGKSFVSRTTLQTIWKSQEIVVLRAVPFHPLTNNETLAEILREQEALGNKHFAKIRKRFMKEEAEAIRFFSDFLI